MTIVPCIITTVASEERIRTLSVGFIDEIRYKSYNTEKLRPLLYKGRRLYKLEKIAHKRRGGD
jgi:hypothetical protein